MSDPFLTMQRQIQALQDELERLRKADTIIYSTGTYNPTYTGNSTAGVTTYSLQQGAYTRIGNVVIVTGTVVWTAATGTGNANISLPFTTANVSNQFLSGSVRVESVTFANSTPEIVISPATAFFNLISPITNAGGTTVQVEAAGNIIFTIAFFV